MLDNIGKITGEALRQIFNIGQTKPQPDDAKWQRIREALEEIAAQEFKNGE